MVGDSTQHCLNAVEKPQRDCFPLLALDGSTIAARDALLDARSNLVAAIELNRDAEERTGQSEDVFHMHADVHDSWLAQAAETAQRFGAVVSADEPNVTFQTDHSALTQLTKKRNISNSRLAHWVTTMSEFEGTNACK